VSGAKSLTGLWRRLAIEYPDGTGDTTTDVYWLQAGNIYADLRIPADRPSVSMDQCQHGLTQQELAAIARQEGFAGETSVRGGLCTWHRWLDQQPATPLPDEGRLVFNGRMLVEYGIHAPYVEHWWHESDGDGGYLAFRLQGEREGVLLVVGDYFMRAIARQSKDQGATADPECEISFGRCEGEPGSWTVLRSSLPWREGTRLFVAGSPRITGGADALLEPLAGGTSRTWQLCESSGYTIERISGGM